MHHTDTLHLQTPPKPRRFGLIPLYPQLLPLRHCRPPTLSPIPIHRLPIPPPHPQLPSRLSLLHRKTPNHSSRCTNIPRRPCRHALINSHNPPPNRPLPIVHTHALPPQDKKSARLGATYNRHRPSNWLHRLPIPRKHLPPHELRRHLPRNPNPHRWRQIRHIRQDIPLVLPFLAHGHHHVLPQTRPRSPT